METLLAALGDGSVAVVTPGSQADFVASALESRGFAVGHAARQALDAQVTVVPVALVKGLELDGVVVVEPGRIVDEEQQGLRALYVALDPSDEATRDRARRSAAGRVVGGVT